MLTSTFVGMSAGHRSWSVCEKGLGYSEPSNKKLEEFTDENKDLDLGAREWAAS